LKFLKLKINYILLKTNLFRLRLKKIKSVLFIFIFLFFTNASNATVYYISNYGDDSNNGISPVYPIQSIQKLNSIIFKLQPGDAVLFERGSIFYGQININSSGDNSKPIVFGAYGNGRNPVISGSIPVTGWELYKKKIYRSNVDGIVSDFFLKNERMTLARYPDIGYLKIEQTLPEPKKGFIDNSSKKVNGYWNGSFARIRTENWAYEYSEIKTNRDGKFIFDKETEYPLIKGWGYYLDNNLNELDAEKEWFFEKTGNSQGYLYYCPPGNLNPESLNLNATIYDYGFFSLNELINIVIEDLEFRNQNLSGIYFAKSKSSVRIDNCIFSGQNQLGLYLSDKSENNTINNCRFYNINGKAVYLLNTKNSKIISNIFMNIGMTAGYGTTGDAFPMTAILVFGNNNIVSENYINRIGHDGINCIGEGNLIEKNIIKNCLLLLNDGGGIKCFGKDSRNSKWQNNFVFNVKGNNESTDIDHIIAIGIYLDMNSGFNTIKNNTVADCGLSGIGLNDGFNNVVEKNVCYNNPAGINFYQNNKTAINNFISKNIIIGKNEGQNSIEIQIDRNGVLPGRLDSNIYFNKSDMNTFRIIENNSGRDYSYSEWKEIVNTDLHSKILENNGYNFSKLILNMSDDSLKYLLRHEKSYKDINFIDLYGSVVLEPWSSFVLLSNSEINNTPDITIGGSALEFEKTLESTESKPKWFCLSGQSLTSEVNISSPEGFEISLDDNSGYSKNLILNPEKGKIEKIIFVRFVPGEEKKFYDYIISRNQNITVKIKVSGSSR